MIMLGSGYGGACVQCSYGPCLTAYHPYCGFINGISMASTVDRRGFSHYSIFCRKHDSSSKTGPQRVGKMHGTDSAAFFSKNDIEGNGGKRGEGVDCRGKSQGSGLFNGASPQELLDSPTDSLQDTAIKGPRSAALRRSGVCGFGIANNTNASSAHPSRKRYFKIFKSTSLRNLSLYGVLI